jgi:hypothetical protein
MRGDYPNRTLVSYKNKESQSILLIIFIKLSRFLIRNEHLQKIELKINTPLVNVIK